MRFFILFSLLLPTFCIQAQIQGTYATTFNGNGRLLLSFEKDSSFTYEMKNRRIGEKGRGVFAVSSDTLSFTFVPFLDSGRVDCSTHEIRSDSGKIAVPRERNGPTDTIPIKDSMFVSFRLMDCQTGEPLDSVILEIPNGKKSYLLGITDREGVLKKKLTHNLKKRYKVRTRSSRYHSKQISMAFGWNCEVDIWLYQSEMAVLEKGKQKQFRIDSLHNRFLDITPIPTDKKASMHLRKGRNLAKINKLEYKDYLRQLKEEEMAGLKQEED